MPTLPKKLAFVDIETTGGRSAYDRIIEIGIVRVQDDKILDTYSTLINPERRIPPEIEQITGITETDVTSAPLFSNVAAEIITLLKDHTFVAHNVRFDYGFLKAEFARLGANFSSKHFCTVRLSRALYPTARRHNLDSIIERFALTCKNRHRALDDALTISSFYHKAHEQTEETIFINAMKLVMKKPYLPIKLDQNILDNLPESPGVYTFYGEDGAPLYIGKSINIKNRVLSHFAGDIHSPLEMKIAQQVKSIETTETAGELGALFLESNLVKTKLPLFNKQLRLSHELISISQSSDENGYATVIMDRLSKPTADQVLNVLGVFRSRKQAKEFLSVISKEYRLCEKLLGLEKTNTACFSYRLDRCEGACVGKESSLQYNLRFVQAFSKTKLKHWPYPGPIIIDEINRLHDKVESFIIDKWCLIGSVTQDTYGSYKEEFNPYTFDLDTYKILVRFLTSGKNEKRIRLAKSIQENFHYENSTKE